MHPKSALPIDSSLEAISRQIETGSGRLILESPAGSGKSTRLAPHLLKHFSGKIFLLQPRRSSTLLLAQRISEENGWRVGSEVGYLMRLEKKFTAQTKLIVATHGSFLQYLSNQPSLDGVSAVIVDEFHERSLDIDLVSGLLRYSQRELRPDLRLVWMSATGGADSAARLLDAELVKLEGRGFPIQLIYQPVAKKTFDPLEALNAETLRALREIQLENSGARVLVFLPGTREIVNLERLILADSKLKNFSVLQLHGSLELSAQERVIQSSTPAQIVLATNVAETSLTLKDIHYVVDMGYQKLLSFDESSGREYLQLESISADAATQRAGRCGRTAPGTCYRLWSEDSQRFRPVQQKPEILRRSLEGAMLRLIEFGFGDLAEFPWITPPKDSSVDKILRLLKKINVVEGEAPRHRLSQVGRGSFRWPLEARWGIFLEKASNAGTDFFALAARLASIADPSVRRTSSGEILHALREQLDRSPSQWTRVERELFEDLCARAGVRVGALPSSIAKNWENELRRLLFETFPDFLAKRRGKDSTEAVLASGRGVEWDKDGPSGDYFLALDVALRPNQTDSKLISWLDLSREEVERMLKLYGEEEVWMDDSSGQHRFFRQKKIFGLGIGEAQLVRPSPSEEKNILKDRLLGNWAKLLEANPSYQEISRRLKLVHPDRPLIVNAEFCELYAEASGRRSLDSAHLVEFDFYSILASLISHADLKELDRLAPRALKLPNGRSRAFEYLEDGSVDVSVILQDLLGVNVHPVVGRAKIPVRIHLLSPAKRPIQVTANLPGFWKTSYAEVRKELRGRYPKHKWPEDPLA